MDRQTKKNIRAQYIGMTISLLYAIDKWRNDTDNTKLYVPIAEYRGECDGMISVLKLVDEDFAEQLEALGKYICRRSKIRTERKLTIFGVTADVTCN